ncbi:MAG: serine/threonine protein kinase [Phototrophicaceae bacterium]
MSASVPQQPDSTEQFFTQVGRYVIEQRVGTGGMARVYRAKDTALGRLVAVKILHEYLADDETFRARFEREAKFLASFNHPNVIQIFDYATLEQNDRHLCYMVMTYLPNPSLKQVMDGESERGELMPHPRILQIINDLASALDYAHRMGMVHRDVKPANILFDETGRAILTDFGIARLAQGSKLTQENVTVGTPAYMAPEQASGGAIDGRTDIYALGVILYELLAGKPPFEDDGSLSILLKHLNEPIPLLSELGYIQNGFLDAVLLKVLAKSPEERYQTAAELAQDLDLAIRGETPAALPTLTMRRKQTRQVTNPNLITATVTQALQVIRPSSALGLLVIGGCLIVGIVAAALVVTRSENALPTVPTPEQPQIALVPPTLTFAEIRRLGGASSMVDDVANPAASMTGQVNMPFESGFDEDDPLVGSYWLLGRTMDANASGEILRARGENGTYIFTNSIQNRAATTVLQDYFYDEDIVITVDIMLTEDSPVSSGYGLVFHYLDENNYGVFAVDGAGRYSVWFLENREWRELRGLDETWTPNDAIHPLGLVNQLRLEVRGATLMGYVNDIEVLTLTDDTMTSGMVGVYLATPNREGAVSTAILDRYSVTLLEDGAASMTSDS